MGETGPLEVLLNLNTMLPRTALDTWAKLVLTIKPQLINGLSANSGTLRCWFEKDVACLNITFDYSLFDRSVITWFTPTSLDFTGSEIPIVITTEGGTLTGLTLNPATALYTLTLETFRSGFVGVVESF
jgi:hypothetical protein